MPDANSPAQSVLEALGFVLFLREESGALRLTSPAPEWLRALWPAVAEKNGTLPIAAASPFLENFLIDAEECWRAGGNERAESGPWVEQDANGAEVQLEATAMTAGGKSILLLERLGEAFEAKKMVLQRARETVIAHQLLNSEIQKKEILLHCVADEMTGALANVITSLRLIELENNGPRTKLLIELATRGTQEQQTLINRILGVFEEELRGIYDRSDETQAGADWNAVLRHALESVAPSFTEKNVGLVRPEAAVDELLISVDATHLERVTANLLENALENTPAGGQVLVHFDHEPEAVLLRVEDSGPAMSPDICEDLFAKWESSHTRSPASALRLHFCRIIAANCGGEIGCTALPAGGNRFWIRLPKSRATP